MSKHDPMWDASACIRCGQLYGCDYLEYGPAADVCPECVTDMATKGDPQPTPHHIWYAVYEEQSYREAEAAGLTRELAPDWDTRCYDGRTPDPVLNGAGGFSYALAYEEV